MSAETSTERRKNPSSVSSKCLLNIKSIIAQNLATNSNSRILGRHSTASIHPPLPLVDSKVSTKESNKHLDNSKEIEEQNRKSLPAMTMSSISNDTNNNTSSRKTMKNNGDDQKHKQNIQSKSTSIEIQQKSISKKLEQEQTDAPSGIVNKSKSEQDSSQLFSSMNKKEQSNISSRPLNSSIYSLSSLTLSSQKTPLSSFANQSSNHLNGEYVAELCQTVKSSNSSNESEFTEISIHKNQFLPVNRFDSTSPNISKSDEVNVDDAEITQSIITVNSSLNLSADRIISPNASTQKVKSRLSERTEKEYNNHRRMTMNNHTQQYIPNPRCPTSYTRLPHALRNMNQPIQSPLSGSSITTTAHLSHRRFPQFESVRTPLHKSPLVTKQQSPSAIPSELFNCCQTESDSLPTEFIIKQQRKSQQQLTTIEINMNECEGRSNYFRDVSKIREIMINASNRLTKDIDSKSTLPIVDTHCHFDLIFDRLRIKHNDLKQYFKDYSEYYPSGLSFELAIQVFWRPRQLTENNWTSWFSRYLDDERVYGACGIHPHWSSEWKETSVIDIERCLQHPKVVAIGEIGLDFGPKNECLVHQQCRAFEGQLKLAAKWLKPIVIHSRDAYKETFTLMKQYLEPDHRIHLHCFVGTMDDVSLFTSYFTEIKFGFTPIITRSNFLHATIQQLELTQILSETDSPYFTPNELNAFSRCAHPGMVYSVVEMIAQLRHLPVIDVAYQLRENARHIYGV